MQLGKPWCSTCCVHFNTFEEHREHSKSEEHVLKIQIRYSGPSIPRYVREKVMENWERAKESWNELQDTKPGDELESGQAEFPEFHEELCLFCRHMSLSFDENMAHMKSCHSFTIPSLESLVTEPKTVVRYLHRIIFGFYECISCGKQRHTLEGIQHHMAAKNHCHFQMTHEILRFCKNEDKDSAQETQIIRSIQDSHNDKAIIRSPTLQRSAQVLMRESTGDDHHIYEKKQEECYIVENPQEVVTETETLETPGDQAEVTQQLHRAFHEVPPIHRPERRAFGWDFPTFNLGRVECSKSE